MNASPLQQWDGIHLIFTNIFVGAKHFGSKYLVLTNKLSAEMLRPSKMRDAPAATSQEYPNLCKYILHSLGCSQKLNSIAQECLNV